MQIRGLWEWERDAVRKDSEYRVKLLETDIVVAKIWTSVILLT